MVTKKNLSRFVITLAVLSMSFATFATALAQEAGQPETKLSADNMEQLVAPIALYPDALVAQILAAATYPTQIVEADRWLQRNSNLQGAQLAAEIDKQSWDPSVKAVTAFPSVLANLDRNLSWTTALGEAYFNQQQEALDAVQIMRQRAEAAGNLETSPQERVINKGPTIIVEPTDPEVCYVPIYDPWVVYGAPVPIYPGYFYDEWFGPPYISFGPAIGIGFLGGFRWGWPAWGFNWGSRVIVFNHNAFVPRGPFFFHRGPLASGWSVHPHGFPGRVERGFNSTHVAPSLRAGVNGWGNRSWSTPRGSFGSRAGSFNGARSGGLSRAPVFGSGLGRGRSGFGSAGHSFGGGHNTGGGRHH